VLICYKDLNITASMRIQKGGNRKTKYMFRKGLVVAVIVLFIVISVIPSTGTLVFDDDTTPPLTTCSLDPPEPNGDNGWYVSDVNVTLNATDDMSGVKEIRYKINGKPGNISGSYGTFTISRDGEDILIEYYAIDNAGNEEDINSCNIKIDQTKPQIEIGLKIESGEIFITANASDWESGMNRVEFCYCNDSQEAVYGAGPFYQWKWNETNMSEYKEYSADGFIINPEFIDKNITFFAIILFIENFTFNSYEGTYVVSYDNAGNWMDDHFIIITPCLTPFRKICFFQKVSLPRYYDGYLGKFFVSAFFRTWD